LATKQSGCILLF